MAIDEINEILVCDFDKAYLSLTGAITKGDEVLTISSYESWLNARESLKKVMVKLSQSGNLEGIVHIDSLVATAFNSLNAGEANLISGYSKYIEIRVSVLKYFCSPDLLEEIVDSLSIELPLIPGFSSIDLKKIFSIFKKK